MKTNILLMLVITILLTIEILVFLILREIYYSSSKLKFWLSVSVNVILSIWIWYLIIKIKLYRGYFDTPENINNHMILMGLFCGVVIPRFIMIMFHYTGKIFRFRKKGFNRKITLTGMVISCLFLIIVAIGSFKGRYNFKTDEFTVQIKNLPPQLDGLKIIHLSDMHLAGFYRHHSLLQELMERVNGYQPDLIINTGDFINFGWREFDRCDTILSKVKSRYGNFAILGNHDMGTYFPNANKGNKADIVMKVSELIKSSGYTLLYDSNITLRIRGINVELIGVMTSGRFPDIIHGDLVKAMGKSDSSEFKILLAHDPNQWEKDVTGKTDINLTLSGHTHGMQMGIVTNKFRWSPSKRFYPRWSGLYAEGDQFLYVNRGLGVLAIPFRIWMPPEITMITLKSD